MKLIVSTFLVYKVKKCLQKSGKVTEKSGKVNFALPKLRPLVWALIARLVSNGCSSHVHRFPIT